MLRQQINNRKKSSKAIIIDKKSDCQNENEHLPLQMLLTVDNDPSFQKERKGTLSKDLNNSIIADNNGNKKEEVYLLHLASIVESSDDAIIGQSLDGLLKSWNKGSEKMFGYTSKQAVGKHISLIIPPDIINEEKEFIKRIRINESIDHYETIRINKNGKRLNVSITASPMKDQAGIIIGVSKIIRDITSSKVYEAELIKANNELIFQGEENENLAAELVIADKELVFQNDEITKTAAELIIAYKELVFQNEEKEKRAAELIIANKELIFQNEEKEKRAAELTIANKELEQFAYIASHDLQEPLRTISNYMQVIEEDYLAMLDNNARKYIRSVKDATERMSKLVSSLLDFSRLGRDKKLVQTGLNKIINNVIEDLQTTIKKSNAIIRVAKMPELNIYEVEMGQLFQNLITNAIKFQKNNNRPEIQISCKKLNKKWQFSVKDNGIGIDPVYFDRIFDIFQRLHSNHKYQGNGIGLANCKKIVELHHGEIWIESTLGKGTTFNFTIPNLSL